MAIEDSIYKFQTKIAKYDFGKYYYTVVFLPSELISKLPLEKYPRLRVNAEIDGFPIQGAFMPDKGHWYLMTPRRVLKNISKSLGDEVFVQFNIADQDAIEIPPDLELVLKENVEVKLRWDKLTTGKKRGLAYSLSKIKTPEIRERRLLEIIDSL